jgi:hypothetical protein
MTTAPRSSQVPPAPSSRGLLIFSWLFVGIPLAWGVAQTLIKSMALFH